jgi:hypothetical protein
MYYVYIYMHMQTPSFDVIRLPILTSKNQKWCVHLHQHDLSTCSDPSQVLQRVWSEIGFVGKRSSATRSDLSR